MNKTTLENNVGDALKAEIRSRLPEYVQIVARPDRKSGEGFFTCPICDSGNHGSRNSDGAFHLTGEKWYCHSCNRGGDIFSLYGDIHKLDTSSPEDFKEILNGLKRELGIADQATPGRSVPASQEKKTIVKKEDPTPDQKKLDEIERYASQMSGSPGEKYLRERGLSDTIIRKYRLGYNPTRYVRKEGRSFETVVIPYPGTDYFTERLIAPGDADKYQNNPGGAPVYTIKEGKNDLFFITEGQIDALSLRQAGAKNVIASHYPSKIESLLDEGFRIDGAIYVADLDEDSKRNEKDGLTPGERNAKNIKEILEKHGAKCLVVYPPEGFKDSNDILKGKGADYLKDLIIDWSMQLDQIPDVKNDEETQAGSEAAVPEVRSINLRSYLSEGGFEADLDYFRKYRDRKTGFKDIDEHLTLYPGLGALTGATSLGKTSFCVQLADQLVERGETVLYFSLEQAPIELASKILARRVYARNPLSKINNIDIRNGASSDDLEAVKKAFLSVSERFNIIASDFNLTADQIVKYVEDFIKEKEIRPVVIIDYLQIIASPEGRDPRDRVDDAVKRFKKLSRDQELFILMISNMARSTYREKIGEDSFKESGLIEYTCDYLFGLQLAILEDDSFFSKKGSRGGEKETLKSEKQDKIDEASEAIPKDVVFKSVKNRNGKKVFRAFFKYHPDFDFFEEDKDKSISEGWRTTTKAPFLTV